MEALLTIQDVMYLLRVSEPTIRRWLAESRTGIGNFPKPINIMGRKLLWHPTDIEKWSNYSPIQNAPPPPSPAATKQRNRKAVADLESLGIRVPGKGGASG